MPQGNFYINDPRESLNRLMQSFQMLGEARRNSQAMEEQSKAREVQQNLALLTALMGGIEKGAGTPEMQGTLDTITQRLNVPSFKVNPATKTTVKTSITETMIGGKPHKVLVDDMTGSMIRDLGEARPSPSFNMETFLSPADAERLGVPYGTTKKGAAQQGLFALGAGQRENLSQAKSAIPVVEQIKRLSQKVNTASGGLDRFTTGIANKASTITQSNPDAVLLDKVGSKLSTIIRGLGEKGTLAEGDVQRGIDSIPNIWDTAEVAQQKVAALEEIFMGVSSAKKGVYTQQFPARQQPQPAVNAPAPQGRRPGEY